MSNSGVFDVNDIRYLMDYQQWTGVGNIELIETQSASGVGNVAFTHIKQDIYNVHFLTINDYQGASSDWLAMRFYESGTLETAAQYHKALRYGYYSGSWGANTSTGVSYIYTGVESTTSSNITGNGYVYIYNAGDDSRYTTATVQSVNSAGQYMMFGGGSLNQASIVDGIYLYGGAAASNITGDFSLYGIRYS